MSRPPATQGSEARPAIAVALGEAMDAWGVKVTDLARAIDVPPETLRNILAGRVREPSSEVLRAGLDEFFHAGRGATLRICRHGGSYPPPPGDVLRQLELALEPFPPGAVAHLAAFLQALSGEN